MIKQLMVAIDGTEYGEAAVRHACFLARKHDARLCGVAVIDTEGIEAAYHTSRPLGAGSADAGLYKKHLEEAGTWAENAVKMFEAICKKEQVKHQSETRKGDPVREILEAARLNDLVVMGRKTRLAFACADGEFCDTWWEVLVNSTRPLILAPKQHREVKNVMIAMDLGRLADRLLFNYIHLNPYPGVKVHLVHVAADGQKEKNIPDSVVEYFKVHGFDVVPEILRGDHAGQAIVNYSVTKNIDLAVIGVHTVSKLIAALLGSTTRYAIEHLEIPILAQT